MLRKTITIFSLISLLLSVTAWGVSYWDVERQGLHAVELSRGCVVVGYWWDGSREMCGMPKGWSYSAFSGMATIWVPSWSFEATFGMSYYHGWHVEIPLWIPTLLSVFAASFLRLSPIHRRHKRKKLGLCLKCGYDLRASMERCPECGIVFIPDGCKH